MRFLIDTHIVLAVLDGDPYRHGPRLGDLLEDAGHDLYASVTSLWEIMIKWRLGKLGLSHAPNVISGSLERIGITLLPLTAGQVLASHDPQPATRDPFDRILLAICRHEDMRLLTADTALHDHPMVFSGAS